MSHRVNCYNCEALMYVEWDVHATCTRCGQGQTVRHPITPEEEKLIEKWKKEKEEEKEHDKNH